MTLILSYANDHVVMQASDRRLSLQGQPLPDERNKAVVWCNLASIAFTGFAYVDAGQKRPTDIWIMKTLRGQQSVSAVMDSLATGGQQVLRRVPWENKMLAFSIVGWAPQPAGDVAPFVALVSNMHDDGGAPLAQPRRDFAQLLAWCPKGGYVCAPAGGQLTAQEEHALHDQMRELTAAGRHPAALANALRHSIHRVARRDRRIGRNLMVTCIPRKLAGSPHLVSGYKEMPGYDAATFCYLDEHGNVTEAFGPHTVCGTTAMSDLKVEFLNDTGTDHSVEVTIHSL